MLLYLWQINTLRNSAARLPSLAVSCYPRRVSVCPAKGPSANPNGASPSPGDWLSWLDDQQLHVSRTGVCCSSCAKRLIYPREISKGGHKWCEWEWLPWAPRAELILVLSCLSPRINSASWSSSAILTLPCIFVRQSSHQNACFGKGCFCPKLWRCWWAVCTELSCPALLLSEC